MSRYFFSIANGHPFEDDEGTDLPDDTAAWREAVLTVRDIESALQPGGCWTLEVRRDGEIIIRIDIRATTIANL
ncbi:DUF6894 family protein [Bradyrhizobium japonicum]|jgi:hypothetical protein|uniref:DUF6894 family protein n=1 Tax=Bradyrhizobium japonicum TaxID=375 RepID=UPI000675E892